ncbi:YhdP family protein [Crenalkalicoccus roseus]|uniref:YhdP family protein n=1 Tax=Crenalkalicoccus roseus TaxID=1485588 RepID=UPI001080DD3D|nr:DUF3971 domain-containing protein [Crenalkalicoccus roseus]
MRAGLGQALRWLQRLIRVVLALAMLLAVGLGALAWRLAEGPLALDPLARQIERAANAGREGMRIEVGGAAIAWGGWHGGAAAPLEIRLTDVRLIGREGALGADLPDAAVTLSVPALLRGRLAPATILLRAPALLVHRDAEGRVSLDSSPAPAPEEAPPAPDALPFEVLLSDLMRPAADHAAHAALRRVRVTEAEVLVVDRRLGRRWTLSGTELDIRRGAEGGLAAEGAATIRSGGLAVPVRLFGAAAGAPMRASAGLALPALRPAELAAIWPDLAPLRVLDAPVALVATAELGPDGQPERVQARLEAGAGALALGGAPLRFAALEAALEAEGATARLRAARLRLPGPPEAVLTAEGVARLRGGAWEAALDLALAPLSVAHLGRHWPEGLAPEARAAVLGALPAGWLRAASLRLSFRASEALEEAALREARLALALETPLLDLGPLGRVPAREAALAATLTPEAVRLERATLRLPAPPGGTLPGPVLEAAGEAARGAGGWRGALDLSLDRVRFADLAAYWPEGLRRDVREWITGNITAGEVVGGRWRFEAAMPEGADSLRLTALSGRAEARGATVHWLRPVPPVQGVDATAEFSLDEIALRLRGGRQLAGEGGRGGLELREGRIRLHDLTGIPGQIEIALQTAGPLPEVFALIRHPRLHLFDRRRLEVGAAAGQAEAQVTIAFPLWREVPLEQMRIRAAGRVTEARLTDALLGQDLERAALEVAVDTEGLRLSGQGMLVGAPLRLSYETDFRPGPAAGVVERATATGRMEARQLAALGFETHGVLAGPVAVEARFERRRNGQGQVSLRGDLREARLAAEGLGWVKPPGAAGQAQALLRLQGEALLAAEAMQLDAAGLALRGAARFGPAGRLERVHITEGALGASRFGGEVRRPAQEGGAWTVLLRGPLLDLRPILAPRGGAPGGRGGEADPPLLLDLRFGRVTMGAGRDMLDVALVARTDALGVLREARAEGRTAAQGGAFAFTLTPRGQERHLRLTAENGGALLRALDLADPIEGGRLSVTAVYPEARPGAPLIGTAELDQFVVRNAPALGKLLQAMTLYGVLEALQGGSGLAFARLVAPFTLTPEALTLRDARAFSASLGLTAKGRIWRERSHIDIEGTLVPAWFFNQLLGNIPILGRLFSPEAGGGVFAATYRVQGPFAEPVVTVNPLAALTPGFLRGLFALGEGGAGQAPPDPTER